MGHYIFDGLGGRRSRIIKSPIMMDAHWAWKRTICRQTHLSGGEATTRRPRANPRPGAGHSHA